MPVLSCPSCRRMVLGIPWHDLRVGDEAMHQVCLMSDASRAGRWTRALRDSPDRAAGPDEGWTLTLRGDAGLAVHDSGRSANLTWARVRTIAIGNLEVPLLATIDSRDTPGWPDLRDRLATERTLPLDEALAVLGWSSAIVAPEEVIGARVTHREQGLGLLVPWSVPPPVTRLAGALAGRGSREP